MRETGRNVACWARAGLLALALAALPAAARAQQAQGIDGLLETLQLKARLAPAPDFVTKSQPAKDPGFIPVGKAHPDRATHVMTPAELAAAEADLDATRERQQRRAGQKPAIVPMKTSTSKPPK